MVDFSSIIGNVFSPVASFFKNIICFTFLAILISLLSFLLYFFIRYGFNPIHLDANKLREPYIKNKWYDLIRWLLVDYLERDRHQGEFKEYGFTFFVGRQGAGKTISMVRYLEVMKEKYPNCIIVTNFGYYRSDWIMESWRDIETIKNGTDGVIFAVDEIHSEYSTASWKDVPESLLSEISQQRKQRVKIVATAQFFSRIAKPLREQASSVISCTTFAGRLTKTKEYDALEYAMIIDNPNVVKKKLRPLSKSSFVQSDALCVSYDTYEKIKSMRNTKFIPRAERE